MLPINCAGRPVFNLNRKRFAERAKSLEIPFSRFCDWPAPGGEDRIRDVASVILQNHDSGGNSTKLVSGCPGSGKTTILLETARLLLDRGVEPGAIAFFVKSSAVAERLRWEIDAVLGRKLSLSVNSDGIWCCTPEMLSTIILRNSDYQHKPRTRCSQTETSEVSPKIVAALELLQGSSSALCSRFSRVFIDDYEEFHETDFELIANVVSSARVTIFGDHCQQTRPGPSARELLKRFFGVFEEITLGASFRMRDGGIEFVEDARTLVEGGAVPRRSAKRLPANICVLGTEDRAIEAYVICQMIKKFNQDCPESNIAVVFQDPSLALPLRFELAFRQQELLFKNPFPIPSEFLPLLHALRFKHCILDGALVVSVDAAQVVSGFYGEAAVPDCIGRLDIRYYTGFTPRHQLQGPLAYDDLRTMLKETRQLEALKSIEKFVQAKSVDDALRVLIKHFPSLVPPASADIRDILSRHDDDPTNLVQILLRSEQNPFASMKRPSVDAFLGLEPALPNGRVTPVICSFSEAKRTEFHSVIIASCNEEFLPGNSDENHNALRLLYSTMGRARCNLIITYAEKISGKPAQPSQLLSDLSLLSAT